MKSYYKTAAINVEQFDGSDEMIEKYNITPPMPLDPDYTINTLEGDMVLGVGDWIATGVNGEHWVIQSEIFNATYEIAEEPIEIWKQVQSFEGCYEVSSLGRVRSIKRIDNNGKVVPQRVLKMQTDKDGYLLVGLHKNGKRVTRRVHRLVASEFIPNNNGLPQINHIDRDKKNNCVGNLEWCDNKYNQYYDGTFRKANMATSTPVVALKDNEIVHMFKSTNEAGRYFGKKSGTLIQKCINNEKGYKTAYGYHWSKLPIADDVFNKTYSELPVIPKAVADWIKKCKHDGIAIASAMDKDKFPEKVADYFRTYYTRDQWITIQNNFVRAWLDGYVVEED